MKHTRFLEEGLDADRDVAQEGDSSGAEWTSPSTNKLDIDLDWELVL
ncbi:hypothetical protein [Paenibacillus sp. L3-i20]|nr:hypothetical protein [Paenibacillus sp. L3-i20]GKU77018.1 hypothetical protein L3i20_v214150 [Paenibacillus sp. L3-i20]